MTQLNITLPDDIAKRLAVIPNKSRFIAKVLKEKFEQERRNEVERLMIEGYKATNLGKNGIKKLS
jgi:hypothetical protein